MSNAEPPFGIARVGRDLDVCFDVEELVAGGFAGQVPGTRWTYVLRAYDPEGALDAFLLEQEIDPHTDQSTFPGRYASPVPLGATPRAALQWELVAIDGTGSNPNSSSGQPEYVRMEWRQPILAAAIE